MRACLDSDHTGESAPQRLRTDYIIFLNGSPIYWTSKKQGSVEASSFVSEFITMKTYCKYIHEFIYKLRMMGVPCNSSIYIYGDNESVFVNTLKLLAKRHEGWVQLP